MKIEKIEFCNLTSYEGVHEIDFTVEPLRSANIFAICGDTGAGKTTILDAICLALYNKAPRLGATPKIPKEMVNRDADNAQGLQPDDVRNFMRRGTKEAWVRIFFSMPDGARYMAQWECSLTRNGKYRSNDPLIRLECIKPKHKVYDANRTDVLKEIERVIGLSFEQFCRTVLLAQNQFATFLTADESKKSELLEKLTGSEIYGRVSQKIHALSAEAQVEKEKVESRIEGLQREQLSPEQLTETENALQLEQTEMKGVKEQLEDIRAQLEWYDRFNKAKQQVEATKTEYDAARKRLLQKSSAQQRLDRHDKVNEIAPLYTQIEEAEMTHKEQQYALTEEEKEQLSLKDEQKRCLEVKTVKEKNYRNATEKNKEMAEAFAEGHLLEGRIEEAQKTLTHAEKTLATAQKEEDSLQKRYTTAKEEQRKLEESLAEWQKKKDELQEHESMLKNMAVIQLQLKEFYRHDSDIHNGQNTIDKWQSDIEQMRKNLLLTERKKEEIDNEVERLYDTYHKAQYAIMGIDDVALQKRSSDLRNRVTMLRAAEGLWQTIAVHFDEYDAAKANVSRLKINIEQWQHQIEGLNEEYKRSKQYYEEEHHKYTLSQGQAVQHLRENLSEGSPCPVCGSTHHPYHASMDIEDNKVFKEIEERCAMLKEDMEIKQQHIKETESKLIKAQSEDEYNVQRVEQLSLALEREKEQWKEYASLDYSLKECSSHIDAESRINTIKVLRDMAQQEFDECCYQLKTYNEHNKTIRNTLNELAEKEKKQRQLNDDYNESSNAENELQKEIERLRMELDKSKLSYKQLYNELEMSITLSDWLNRYKTQKEKLPKELQQMTDTYLSVTQRLSKAEVKKSDYENEVKNSQQRLEEAQQRTKEAQQQYTLKSEDYTSLQKKLDDLFHHKTLKEAETEMNKALHDATQEYEEATEQLNESEKKLHRCEGLIEQRTQTLRRTALLIAERNEKLDQWITLFNANEPTTLYRQELPQLLSTKENWQAIREDIDGAKDQERAAKQRFKDAQNEYLTLQNEGTQWPQIVSVTRQDLLTDRQTWERKEEDLQRNIHALQTKIEAHERSIRNVGEEQATLQEVTQNAADWLRLDKEFGSTDGKKFRAIAQRYTFRFLVDYANAQLSLFSPRYRLSMMPGTLTLKIYDRDMFDEERYVASLSGGETFVVSLALALGLANLSSEGLSIGSLFIDEGFGNLDAESLDLVMNALSTLEASQGRKVGVISHTEQIKEQISPQIIVNKIAGEARSIIAIH